MPEFDKGKMFVNEFVIGLGLLSGLWMNVGIDPETAILNALVQTFQSLMPNAPVWAIVWIPSTLSTVLSWILAFVLGGWVGIIAVVLALLAGIFLNTVGGYLLLFAILLGLAAPYVKENFNF